MKYTAERLKFQFHNGTIKTLDTNHKGGYVEVVSIP